MELILDQFLNDFNPAPEECSYYVHCRKFLNDSVEMLVKTIRPMQQHQAKFRYENGGGFAMHRSDDLSESEKEQAKQDSHARSVRRARQKIRWLCKQLCADRLLTLTYRDNMQDREKLKADFQEFLRLVRKVYKGWPYVAVVERQDRGAFHIHIAVRGFQKIGFIRSCWYRAIGGTSQDSGSETLGQVDITSPRNQEGKRLKQWKTNRLASYITKYLDKTFDGQFEEKRRYWHARDLKAPQKKRIWLSATNMADAISETWKVADKFYGISDNCFQWLSESETDYFLTADCHEIPF